MAAFLNVCRFNPTAGGTTNWTVSAGVAGYLAPAAAGAVNGRVYKYRAESADLSQWEIGEGSYSAGVLARTTVLFNSAGTTAKINFSAPPQVAVIALKEDLISIEEGNSFTAAQQAQARLNIGAQQTVTFGILYLASNVALPTIGSWFDVLTQSLAAGTYLLVGKASVRSTSGASALAVRLSDGTTVYDTSNYVNTTGAGAREQAVVTTLITLGSTTTVRLQGMDAGSASGMVSANEQGNASPKDTSLIWVKVG